MADEQAAEPTAQTEAQGATETPTTEATETAVVEVVVAPTGTDGAGPSVPVVTSDAFPDPRTAFLAALRARLATANYGLSANLGLSFSAQSLLLLEADTPQEALRAASAALDGAGDDGRVWRFLGCGLDLDTGRYRAAMRVTPLP